MTAIKQTETRSRPSNPYPFVFSTFDRNVPKRDLEIIKTTALYCVVNEQYNYMETLREKCGDNPTLTFLDPNHPLNDTFTTFINQYKQVALKDFGKLIDLGKYHKFTVLKRSFQRAEYEEYSQKLQVEQKKNHDRFKLKFSAYDWENFELIGSIDFTDDENSEFAPPLSFEDLHLRSLQKAQIKTFAGKVALSSLPQNQPNVNERDGEQSKLKRKSKIKIRAAGETRLKQRNQPRDTSGATKLVECPITHRMIPEDNFDRHIQVLLSDPNYSREREEYESKNNITNLTLESVHQNIKRLSKTTHPPAEKRQRT